MVCKNGMTIPLMTEWIEEEINSLLKLAGGFSSAIQFTTNSRWSIEDHFNTQKNRGGKLHHKFNRNNFNAII